MKYPSTLPQALLQRGKFFFQNHDFDKALEDFNQLIDLGNNNAEAHYYKAFSLLGQNNLIDAAVSLEQVIKYDTNKKFTGPAIYNLGAIKIKQRDFYGAHFTFQRSIELGLEIDEQKVLKSYVEAILLLIKRKFKEGVTALTKIIKKKHMLIQEYMGNCYAYRGYAYASLENHEKAVKDLNSAKKIQDLDYSSQYNLLVSQAILYGECENALTLLEKAGELFPRNIEPIEYKAAISFTMSKAEKKQEFSIAAKSLLDSAIKLRDSDSDLYFFRGIVLYSIGKPIEAVYDFEQAIDKAEDNIANHFLARGLCSARLKMYKEAIQDFSIAIQLDEKLVDAYYYRGRCGLIIEDSNLALKDFQKMLALKPSDYISHIRTGNLLMLTGSIEEALKAYENANNLSDNLTIITQKINCYLIQENIPAVIAEIHKCNQIAKNVKNNYDIEVLNVLQNALSETGTSYTKTISQLTSILQYKNEGNFCKNLHVHWYKGVFFFLSGDFQKAYSEFSSVIEKRSKKSKSMERNNMELIYNIVLCCIFTEKYQEALSNLHDIVYFTEDNDRGKILLLMGILHYAMDMKKDAKKILNEAFAHDSETVGLFLEEKSEVKVFPLSSASKYAEKFKYVKVRIGDSNPIYLRPSFSLPLPDLPNFEFEVEENILQCFTINTVKCKPETPWLNRVKGSIQFTDEIQHIESESVSEEVEVKVEHSNIFSEKSIRNIKSQEITIRSPLDKNKKIDSNSSLSEILDDIDSLNF